MSVQQRTLDALEGIRDNVHELNARVDSISTHVLHLNSRMRGVERKLGLLYTPFQASIYEYHVSKMAAKEDETNAPAF